MGDRQVHVAHVAHHGGVDRQDRIDGQAVGQGLDDGRLGTRGAMGSIDPLASLAPLS